MLLSHLAHELRRTKEVKLFIEVATGNAAARGLYEAQGFVVTAKRKAYYEKPEGAREDAIVMMKALA
jgi:ribosomal-protein-alanine N-acetyltransferase